MDWGLILTVPFLTALAGVLAATVTDIKTHEVPDWVSYTLIALGVLFGAIVSITQQNIVVLYSLTGLAVGYTVGAGLYYTGQWGGGDAKLLMGLGAIFTVPWQWIAPAAKQFVTLSFFAEPIVLPFFIRFLGYLAVCGAVYGIAWMFYLIIRNWKKFKPLYTKQLHAYKWYRVAIWIAALAFIAFALIIRGVPGVLMTLLAILVFGSFYLIVAVRIAEANFMLKTIHAKQLTEGDWVVGGVKLGSEWIIPEKNIGATNEQIAVLKKKAPNKEVIVKEGIPFVPSFLAALIVAAL